MAAPVHLRVEDVTKRFGGVTALSHLSLEARRGLITSIIGSNGAGKTTLLNVISRLIPADEGRILLDGNDISRLAPHQVVSRGIARTFQQLRIFEKLTVLENVVLGFQDNQGEALWRLFGRPLAAVASERANRSRAEGVIESLGLLEHVGAPAGRLSYGHQKLVSLARVMATGADLLMLDEPTSGLPPELVGGILTIVRKLAAEGKTVLLIEHDMDVVFDVSDWIVVLDEGRRIFEGTTGEVRRNAEVRALYFGTRVG